MFAALAEHLPASALWTLLLAVMTRRGGSAHTEGPARPVGTRSVHAAVGDRRPPSAGRRRRPLRGRARTSRRSNCRHSRHSASVRCIAPTSQQRVVSALRGTEVVADPTNVLALECARRLKADPTQIIRLATSHRAVRAQPAPKGPGYSQHFRLFCLATAGRERVDHGFTVEHLIKHIGAHLTALDRLEAGGYAFVDRHLRVLSTSQRAGAADRIASAFGDLPVVRGALEHPYYDGLRFNVTARPPDGSEPHALIDGGVFNWLGTITSNHRLAFVASAIGSQMVATRYAL